MDASSNSKCVNDSVSQITYRSITGSQSYSLSGSCLLRETKTHGSTSWNDSKVFDESRNSNKYWLI
jgi:hypothetical protein